MKQLMLSTDNVNTHKNRVQKCVQYMLSYICINTFSNQGLQCNMLVIKFLNPTFALHVKQFLIIPEKYTAKKYMEKSTAQHPQFWLENLKSNLTEKLF